MREHSATLSRLERDLATTPNRADPWLELARLTARTGTSPGFLRRQTHLGPLLEVARQHPSEPQLYHLVLNLLGLETLPGRSEQSLGLPGRVLRKQDQAPMVLLPGGGFTSRRLGGELLSEVPFFTQTPPLYMDCQEVSVGQYAVFLERSGAPPPRYWKRQLADLSRPVVFVSWNDVVAFAQWCHARPPRESEWERAYGRTPAARFPWGDEEATPEHANFHWESTPRDPRRWEEFLASTDACPRGQSQVGVLNLLGNVQEWSLLDGVEFPPSVPPPSLGLRETPLPNRNCVLRGASWRHREPALHSLARQEADPHTRESTIGFRLVVPVTP
jgi:formylglycine-generating enzyme required for sulfatase activity